jgi:hypothetical protein
MITQGQRSAMNPMLLKVLVFSAAVHVLAALIFGGITVARYIIPDDAQFEEPAQTEQKPPPEVKIEIKPESKPELEPLRNLRTQKVGNIAVNDLNIDLPSSEDAFTVSAGIGGFGGGSLLGSANGRMQFGISSVNVFGIKAKAERILFVIDTSREMVSDNKGGLHSYRIIKDEITQMVSKLSAGTLFNVMLHDHQKTLLFSPQLVAAGTQNHAALIRWIAPINANTNQLGLDSFFMAAKPILKALPNDPVQNSIPERQLTANDTAFIAQFALEQKVDAIFIIAAAHKGFENLPRPLNARENADWNTKINSVEYKAQLAKHNIEVPKMERRITQKLNRINAERAQKGQPPRVINRRHGIYSAHKDIDLEWETEHPGFKPWPFYQPKELEKYFSRLKENLYTQYNKPAPSLNVILFLAEDENYTKEAEDRLKEFVRFFGGRQRIIRGNKEIKKASTVPTSVN